MTCYHPIKIQNKKALPAEAGGAIPFGTTVISVPCGKCIGCRLDRSKVWAMRCVHESLLHTRNCFLTLTYNDDNINLLKIEGSDKLSLVKSHFVNFMKKMRNHYGKMRFFHCGEYGERFERPHHHVCIFGFDFADKQLWSTRNSVRLYRSDEATSLWGYGHTIVGQVTFESAAYVARYITKKINGDMADSWYKGREPEYCTMSRKPGIGKEYLDRWAHEIYRLDEVKLLNGMKLRPGRYYDNRYSIENMERLEKIKIERINKINRIELQKDILITKEKVKKSQMSVFSRSYES